MVSLTAFIRSKHPIWEQSDKPSLLQLQASERRSIQLMQILSPDGIKYDLAV